MTSDRRRNYRAPVDLEVTWRRRNERFQLQAIDLSPRGMLLLTDAPVDLQFVMDLRVALPSGAVVVFGVVRFAGQTRFGRGVGVSLMSMTDEENARWWAFYRSATAAASRPTVSFTQHAA